MTCKKCGYADKNEKTLFGQSLCRICATFAPDKIVEFQDYVNKKIDWKVLESFRENIHVFGEKQKKGMTKKASEGNPVTRAPLGYDILNGNLFPNEDSSKVHSLFRTFLNRNYTLTSLSKNFSLSVNGMKKVLSNRTYLGEIKFDGRIHKGNHQALISPEIFYAVQRKLKDYQRKRKN